MSTIRVNTIQGAAGTGTVSVSTGNKIVGTDVGSVYAPGMILQVVNNYFTTQSSVSIPASYTTFTDIPSFVATITPKSASSTILVQARWFGEMNPQNDNWETMWCIKRNGVAVGYPPSTGAAQGITMASLSYWADDANSTPETMNLTYVDSPATTSAVTYQLCVCSGTETPTIYTNRTVGAPGPGGLEAGGSMITLMEIAQ